jgi:predicted ATPase
MYINIQIITKESLNKYLTMISNKIIEKEFFMELVYLWVEDYKNIQKQGFNFSPNYDVEFSPVYEDKKLSEKSELKITPKVNPLKDFFGKNINVTAIVGENGSGKSSVIDILNLDRDNLRKGSSNYLIVFFGSTKLYYYGSIESLNSKYPISKASIFEPRLIHSETKFRNSTILYKLNGSRIDSMYFFDMICNFKISDNNIFVPYFINFYKFHKNILDNNKYFPKFNCLRLYLIDENKVYKELNFLNVDKQGIKNKLAEINILDRVTILSLINYKVNTDKNFNVTEFIEKEIFNIDIILEEIKNSEDFKKDIKIALEKLKSLTLLEHKNNLKSDDILGYYFEITLDDSDIYSPLYIFQKFSKFNDDTGIETLPIFELDLIDSVDGKLYSGISSGEKTLLILIIQTILDLTNIQNRSFVLLYDEIEQDLHPQWQKKLIKILVDYLLTLNHNGKIHLIITSHSPFLLSDIPKQNIIFLEKDEKTGNCINATDKVDINPFGANIHTLLSHGFFMKDGLMGEFAKSKIDNVIKYLNNDKDTTISSDNDAQNIISIIGEPIIKRELQRMLKNKMELSNKEEIDTIKEEIEFLKHRIEILRKGK